MWDHVSTEKPSLVAFVGIFMGATRRTLARLLLVGPVCAGLALCVACSSREAKKADVGDGVRQHKSALTGNQPDQSVLPESESRLAAGMNATCMILANGALKCWGRNDHFQLGVGPGGNRGHDTAMMGSMLPAVPLGTGLSARSVTVSNFQTCALLSDSSVECWGTNESGSLGIDQGSITIGDNWGEPGNQALRVPLGQRARSLVAGADSFFCAIVDTGDVKCWGNNQSGQLGVGDTTSRGTDPNNGSVENTPKVDLGGHIATAIAGGGDHACAILETGGVRCWGANGSGQLGVGDGLPHGDNKNDPTHAIMDVQLPTGRTAVAIVAGRAHTCVRLDDGSVTCWGDNSFGQLGIGNASTIQGLNNANGQSTLGDALLSVNFGTRRTVRSLSAGADHTCAILDTGELKCWGSNAVGQLGIGSTTNQGDTANTVGDPNPANGVAGMQIVSLGTLRTPRAVVAGGNHTCAWLDDGSVKCWGSNTFGESGLGYPPAVAHGNAAGTMGDNLPAVPLSRWLSSDGYQAHTCAVLDDGSVKCWGDNSDGQLGTGDTKYYGEAAGSMGTGLPSVNLGPGRTALSVGTGRAHSCALLDDHSVRCWGNNSFGQLVLGNPNPTGCASAATPAAGQACWASLPLVNFGGLKAVSLAVGGDTSCAILEDQSLRCWGDNGHYEFGNGTTSDYGDKENQTGPIPATSVGTGRYPVAVTVGIAHVCVLLDNNKVKCWGQNQFGQTGIGSTATYQKTVPTNTLMASADVVTSVVAGGFHTCALLNMGDIKCWGKNDQGQLGLDNTSTIGLDSTPIARVMFSLGAPALSLAMGYNHSCALFAAGGVRCWGYNGYGQCGIQTLGGSNTGVGAIGDAAGEMEELTSNISLGTGASPIGVATSEYKSCALLEDGRIKCWGYNLYGQLGLGTGTYGNIVGYYATDMGDNLAYTPLGANRSALNVVSGDNFNCAILENGPVKCWGKNNSGQLGVGDTASRGTAAAQMGSALPSVLLGSGRSARMLAAGTSHACALLDNGNVKCWGANDSGQLGLGDTASRGSGQNQMGDNLSTVQLGTGRTAVAITAGTAHTCALLDNSTVVCWGANAQGQLGIGNTNPVGNGANQMGDNLVAVNLGSGRVARALAAERNHTCVLLDNATVKCWGQNTNGDLGIDQPNDRGGNPGDMASLQAVDLGTTTPGSTPPVPPRSAILVASSCAVVENGDLKCWGDNTSGQLGIGTSDPHGVASGDMGDSLPLINLGFAHVLGVAARDDHKCAVLDDSTIKCWGNNASGQLGLDVTDQSLSSPPTTSSVLIGSGRSARRSAVGLYHSCALLDDGTVKCWGNNADGELGTGTTATALGRAQSDVFLPVPLGDTDIWNGGAPNSTGQCASGTVISDGNDCTTDACDPATGVTHTPICNSTCPCQTDEGICNVDTDCSPGLICGVNNGAFFNKPRETRICWSSECGASPPNSIPCGWQNAPCGESCLAATPCAADTDCPTGEVCGPHNGSRFGVAESDNVCWPVICTTSAVSNNCGNIFSICGNCVCVSDCSHAQCGTSTDDGCGGQCTTVCTDRQVGCTQDSDCQPGSTCVIHGGARVGLDPNANVCMPAACNDPDVVRVTQCGTTDSLCGLCPSCVPDCEGRVCGLDPRCKVDCGSLNPSGTAPCPPAQCSEAGTCMDSSITQLESVQVLTTDGVLHIVTPVSPMATQGTGPMTGNFGVSDTGAASYRIPIDVPPGRGGLIPNLAVSYSSVRPNGPLGKGWALEGLSTIARCPKKDNMAGQITPISLHDGDQFCLDGQRLVLVSGVDGGEGAHYRTEVDTFVDVILHLVDGTAGPNSFEARTREGHVMYYGATDDSSTYADVKGQTDVPPMKVAWGLSRTEDRTGAHLDIKYEQTVPGGAPYLCNPSTVPARSPCGTREIWPIEITYGGFDNGAVVEAPDRGVTFSYSERADQMRGYAEGGTPVDRTRLLTGIDTWVGTSTARQYELHYQQSSTGVNQIQWIRECTIDAQFSGSQVCRPQTTFQYSPPSNLTYWTGVLSANTVDPNKTMTVLDWNGDGVDDLLVTMLDGSRHILASSSVGSFEHMDASTVTALADSSGKTTITGPGGDATFLTNSDSEPTGAVDDLDGDGLDDFVGIEATDDPNVEGVCDKNYQNCATAFLPVVYRSTSDSTQAGFPSTELYQTVPFSQSLINTFLVDGNGDRMLDLIDVSDSGITFRLNKFNSLDVDQSNVLQSFGTAPISKWSQDGHGTKDLIFDFDGDGGPNLFEYDSQRQIWAGLSIRLKQGSLVDSSFWSEAATPGSGLRANGDPDYLKIIDLNADGAPDILELADETSNDPTKAVRGHINRRGPGFRLATPVTQYANSTWAKSNFWAAVVVDYDGDGRDDLILPTVSLGGTNSQETVNTGKWTIYRNTPPTTSGGPDTLEPSGTIQLPIPSAQKIDFSIANIHLKFPAYSTAVGDFDGDGRKDMAIVDVNNQLSVMAGRGPVADILTQIDDGNGKLIEISYDLHDAQGTLTYTPVYHEKNFTRAIRKVPNLVSEYRVIQQLSSGAESVAKDYVYHYSDARESLFGDGWLSFGHRDVSEQMTGVSAATDFDNTSFDLVSSTFPKAGQPTHVYTSTASDTSPPLTSAASKLEVTTINDWTVGQSDVGLPFAYLQGSTTTGGESDAWVHSVRSATNGYDKYGNLHTQSISVGVNTAINSYSVSNTNTTIDYDQIQSRIDNWLVSLPLTHTTAMTRGEDMQTRVVATTFDGNGRLSTETVDPGLPTELKTTYTPGPTGNITQIDVEETQPAVKSGTCTSTGHLKRSTHYDYGTQGFFVKAITNALGQTTQIRLDPGTGKALLRVDPNGAADRTVYDGFGRIRHHVAPGLDETTEYLQVAQSSDDFLVVEPRTRVQVTGADNSMRFHDFDALGRLVRVGARTFGSANVQQEVTYGANGLIGEVSRPHLGGDTTQGIISYFYDARQRLRTRIEANGAEWDYAYGTPGFIDGGYDLSMPTEAVSVVYTKEPLGSAEPIGRETLVGMDHLGKPVRKYDTLQRSTNYEYGAFDLLGAIDYPDETQTTFNRDNRGQVISETDVDLGVRNFNYDAFGESYRATDPVNERCFSYDALGRMSEVDDADGKTTFSYDGNGTESNLVGHLASTLSPTGDTTTYHYNTDGLLGGMDEGGGSMASISTTIEYDSFGRVDKIHYPDAADQSFVVKHSYDPQSGALLDISNDSTGSSYWHLGALYEGRYPKTETLGNGLQINRDYYPTTGRPKQISTTLQGATGGSPLGLLAYDYYTNGNVKTRTDGANPIETFDYDELDRIKTRTTADQGQGAGSTQQAWTYTLGGAIDTSSALGQYSYNGNSPHAVSAAGGYQWQYYSNGNLLFRTGGDVPGGGQEFVYTAFSLPKYVSNGNSREDDVEFEYNAMGERVWQNQGRVEEISYIPGLYERHLAKSDGSVQHVYRLFALGREVAQVRRQEVGGVSDSNHDQLLYFQDDALGSVKLVTLGDGTIASSRKYEVFGKAAATPDDGGVSSGYTGQETDTALGLINMGGRLYDPAIGVFTTPDPTLDLAGIKAVTPYTYAANNPLRWIDPSGFTSQSADATGTDAAASDTVYYMWAPMSLLGQGDNGQQGVGATQSAGTGQASSSSDALGRAIVDRMLEAMAAMSMPTPGMLDDMYGTSNATSADMAGERPQAWVGVGGDFFHPTAPPPAPDLLRPATREEQWQAAKNEVAREVIDTAVVFAAVLSGPMAHVVMQSLYIPAPPPPTTRRERMMQQSADMVRQGLEFFQIFAMTIATDGGALAEEALVESVGPAEAAAVEASDTAVIGRQIDTAVAKDWAGHDVLDIPDWTIEKNDAWVQAAVDRKATVYIASPLTKANLYDAVAGRFTVFGREVGQFLKAGYKISGDYLVPPP
ncbi:MAG TPA: RHS repeat-associated core domain-containing protein [Polyangiaceae bacterium]|nr:RHS repeat-associated core domain-containing protein [Polyangiaceae bacterium]